MPRARRTPLRVIGQHQTTISAAIGGMSDNQLQCRDFGHSWRPYTVEWVPQHRHYLEALRCTRCRTMRMRLLSDTGELLGNRYVYSDGYLVQGVGRLEQADRDAMRLASLQVLLEGLPGKRMGQAKPSKSRATA